MRFSKPCRNFDWRQCALAALIVWGCSQKNVEGAITAPHENEGHNSGNAAMAPSESGQFGMAELLNLAKSGEVKTAADLIGRLPLYLRQNYSLVAQSRSAQEASALRPRVILFPGLLSWSNSQLVLAFNGDPSMRGYSTMEAIEFDPSQGRYEFRRLRFPADEGGNGRPEISEKNPVQCAQCHTAELRPNWGTYPRWTGALPERDSYTEEEGRALRAFVSSQGLNPRYDALIKPTSFQALVLKAEELQNLFVQQSGSYGARWLTQTPEYAGFRYALVGALGHCEDLPSFVPSTQISSGANQFRSYLKDILLRSAAMAEQGFEEDHSKYSQYVSAGLRFLFEPRGISIRHLNHSFDYPYIMQQAGQITYPQILRELLAQDTELAGAVGQLGAATFFCEGTSCTEGEKKRIEAKCAELKQLSYASLGWKP